MGQYLCHPSIPEHGRDPARAAGGIVSSGIVEALDNFCESLLCVSCRNLVLWKPYTIPKRFRVS